MNSKEREAVMKELDSLKELANSITERINKLVDYVESTGTRDLFED